MGGNRRHMDLVRTSFKREHEETEETEENDQRSIAAVEQIHGLVTEVVGGLRMFKSSRARAACSRY